jgi:hypothetical protein
MSHRTAPGIPLQAATPADCHHSREPFDQLYHVAHGKGLSSDAKVVYAHIVTLSRTQYPHGRYETQAAMAEAVELTRHRVWQAIRDLVAADLIQSIRPGLGMPNYYVLLHLDEVGIERPTGPETAVRPVRERHSGQSGNLARVRTYPEKRRENGRTGTDYGSKSYLETRYGPLPVPCARCGTREHTTAWHV